MRPIRAWALPETAPASSGQAAALEAALDQALVRSLGALPALLPLCEQLGLREIVNRHCYPEGEAPEDLDVGRMALVLASIGCRRPSRWCMWRSGWARACCPRCWALRRPVQRRPAGADPGHAAAPPGCHLAGPGGGGHHPLRLDLRCAVLRLTSLSFCGDYDEAELVRYGYSRDHRPDRKQIELAATVTAAGGVPVDYRTLAGNVADRATPVDNLRRLQGLLALLPPRAPGASCVVVSDRAMLTDAALAAYARSDVCYLGPLDPGLGHGVVRDLLTAVSVEELAAHPLPYRPQRAAKDSDWVAYQGVERTLHVPHPDPSQPPLEVRALVVWSPGKARLDAQLRATQLSRLENALSQLAGKLGRRPYTTPATVQKRVAALLKGHPARPFVTVQVSGGPDTATPLTLRWTRNADRLAEAAARDGRYVLGTNASDLDAAQMLARSKQRDTPEKRFALVKGPLAVRPVYLHKEERVRGLVFCTMVALLLFALLELLTHRAGLSLSGQQVLAQCATLSAVILVLQDGSTLRHLTGLAPPVATLLQRFGWPPADRYVHPAVTS